MMWHTYQQKGASNWRAAKWQATKWPAAEPLRGPKAQIIIFYALFTSLKRSLLKEQEYLVLLTP